MKYIKSNSYFSPLDLSSLITEENLARLKKSDLAITRNRWKLLPLTFYLQSKEEKESLAIIIAVRMSLINLEHITGSGMYTLFNHYISRNKCIPSLANWENYIKLAYKKDRFPESLKDTLSAIRNFYNHYTTRLELSLKEVTK